ncbi:MAG: sugar kinase [Acetivibrionales bacterium]
MSEIWTMGEILVEIMRPKAGMQLYEAGEFLGPYPSGAPAIFIDTVARLGHSAGIIGGVGDDDFGKCVLNRIASDGVDCTHVLKSKDASTAVAFVTYFEDGSRKFIFHIADTPAVKAKCPDTLSINDLKYFHIMGCSLMADRQFYEEIVKTLKMFTAKGAKISFDPNIRQELLGERDINDIIKPIMDECSVLFPGVEELQLITGEENIEAAVEKLFNNEKMEIIALKRGKKGCTVFSRDVRFNLGVYNVVPVDPTGAGDSFDAGFLCGLLEGKALMECAKIATAAASLNTAAFGPMEGNISIDSVKELMETGEMDF